MTTRHIGHSQQEHETSHGSMSKSRWAVESPDAVLELNGRKFRSNDDGALMMCNLFCQEMGRHVHINYYRPSDELETAMAVPKTQPMGITRLDERRVLLRRSNRDPLR